MPRWDSTIGSLRRDLQVHLTPTPGTPIESTDRSIRAMFGDHVDIYDLTRAVEDGSDGADPPGP
ncbi:hypothetical protein [Mycolicibacter kumamotonensis]|uniref:SWI2/SNF2 ATPase domain-containing protein n=1 Tax=Mycolicibacter kumamotonensis TaxID=354243 RepID=A0A7K3LHL2_9MYCO|nr:hypothetical protein [Mycolicibacter kumamotonensis]NDJ91789.1 hypothetical protein [Mycolicibacter kumamotonensis]